MGVLRAPAHLSPSWTRRASGERDLLELEAVHQLRDPQVTLGVGARCGLVGSVEGMVSVAQ